MRHYGHLVAACDNASRLHARVGSGLALGLTRSPIIGPGKAFLSPLRVSSLDKLSPWEWQTGSTKTQLYPSLAKYDSICIQDHRRQAFGNIFRSPGLNAS